VRREGWLGGELGLLLLVGCPVWGAFASTVRNTAACVLQEYSVVFIYLAVIGQVSAFWSFFYDWEFLFLSSILSVCCLRVVLLLVHSAYCKITCG